MRRHFSIFGLLTILITLVFVVSALVKEQSIMTILLFALFVVEFIYAVRRLFKNIILVLFLVAYFTFLMGRLVMPLFIDMDVYSDIFYSFLDFKPETNYHVILSLYISLLFLFISYTITEAKVPNVIQPAFNPNSQKILVVRKWANIILWFSFPFALLVILEKIRYVIINGYAGMLLEQGSTLPSFVIILSVLFEYMVFLYLATLPSKRKAIPVIILYLIFSVMNIIGGDRGECMLSIFVVIYYFFLRNRLYRGSSLWISRKGITAIIMAAPLAMILLFSIAFVRDSKTIDNTDAGLLIGGFFFQQGASMNVIACAYEDERYLPKGKLYSLGSIIDYFRNNYISRLILGTKPLAVGSTELAQKGNSLDPAITYIENPQFYENGGGMGSSYIAEAYYDFGYFGIILYSLIYGYVLASIPKWNAKNVWLSVIALVFLKYIMYAPRARATGFIAAAASVAFWPIALIIYLISSYYSASKDAKKN